MYVNKYMCYARKLRRPTELTPRRAAPRRQLSINAVTNILPKCDCLAIITLTHVLGKTQKKKCIRTRVIMHCHCYILDSSIDTTLRNVNVLYHWQLLTRTRSVVFGAFGCLFVLLSYYFITFRSAGVILLCSYLCLLLFRLSSTSLTFNRILFRYFNIQLRVLILIEYQGDNRNKRKCEWPWLFGNVSGW